MKKIHIIIFFFIFNFKAISEEIIFDYYGFYNWDKIIDINKERRFVIFNTKGIGTSNVGVQTTGGCDGFLEYVRGEIDKSYYICKLEEGNGDSTFFEMKTETGEVDSGITPFIIIEGTGRWKELVGVNCLGAFSMIKSFDENMKNASILFKAKCKIPDASLERLKNYNKEN